MRKKGNIFAGLSSLRSPRMREEQLTALCEGAGMRIERIVSHGHASPPGFFHDQAQDEWVVVLRGAAKLLVEGDDQPIDLKPGDYVAIPAHCRHRVEWTTQDEPTVWLAVHFS